MLLVMFVVVFIIMMFSLCFSLENMLIRLMCLVGVSLVMCWWLDVVGIISMLFGFLMMMLFSE